MWPLLKAGGGNGTERDVAVVASLSARVGSIADNHLGGWHSYRASKTALNQCKILFPWNILKWCLTVLLIAYWWWYEFCSDKNCVGWIRKEEGSNCMHFTAPGYSWYRSVKAIPEECSWRQAFQQGILSAETSFYYKQCKETWQWQILCMGWSRNSLVNSLEVLYLSSI